MLLATVASFTSCKKDKDGSDGPLQLSLSQTALIKSPGDDEVKITAKLSNGKVETVVWESSNTNVATVKQSGSNGIVNFIGYGEATIKCSLKSDPTVFAECKVTVISKFETLKFNRATMSKPQIDSAAAPIFWGIYKPTLVIDPVSGDTTHCDTIWARWANSDLNLISQAVSIDPISGDWQVTDKNGGYMASMPATIQVITRDLNEVIFEDQGWSEPYILATTCAGATYGVLWETRNDGKVYERTLIPGSIDETNYIAKMKEAFTSYNDYILSSYEDEVKLEDFYNKRDSAFAYVKGGKMYQFLYDADYGVWYPSPVACGIVPQAQAKLLYALDDNPYLYSIELDKIVIKPFATAADLNWGLDIEQDEFNDTYKFLSDQVKYEGQVTSIYRLGDE